MSLLYHLRKHLLPWKLSKTFLSCKWFAPYKTIGDWKASVSGPVQGTKMPVKIWLRQNTSQTKKLINIIQKQQQYGGKSEKDNDTPLLVRKQLWRLYKRKINSGFNVAYVMVIFVLNPHCIFSQGLSNFLSLT